MCKVKCLGKIRNPWYSVGLLITITQTFTQSVFFRHRNNSELLIKTNILHVLLMKALVLPLVQEWTIFVASVSCASASSRAGDQTTLDTASRRPHVGSKFSFTDHSNSWTRFYRPCQSMSHDLAASFWANLLTFGHGLMSLEAGHSIWCVYFLWVFFFETI